MNPLYKKKRDGDGGNDTVPGNPTNDRVVRGNPIYEKVQGPGVGMILGVIGGGGIGVSVGLLGGLLTQHYYGDVISQRMAAVTNAAYGTLGF